MSLAKIEARAAAACRHPDLAWVMKYIPKQYRDNPAVIASFLTTAANADPSFADDPAYHAAHASLVELRETRDLRDQVAALYWDPKIRAEYGDEAVERAWKNPSVAYEMLLKRSASSAEGLPRHLDEALNILSEVREFGRANGIAEPAVAEAPIPSDGTKREAEIAELRTKSVTVGLTKAEEARQLKLYEARLGSEIGAEAAAAPRQDGKKPAGEFERLISRSVAAGKLTPDENSRLNELAGERAVETGQISREDLNAEQDQE
jgi:hypothetical protein